MRGIRIVAVQEGLGGLIALGLVAMGVTVSVATHFSKWGTGRGAR